MITTWSMRTLGLLVLAAAAAAIATATAQARPDPEGLRAISLAGAGQAEAVQQRRPTGPAEHTILGGTPAAGLSSPLPRVASATRDDGFDWLAAGAGALAAAAGLALTGGFLTARRRLRVGQA